MKRYDITELRRKRHEPIPEEVNSALVDMINGALKSDDFLTACETVRKRKLFGNICVTDANLQTVVEVTVLSGVLTQAFPFDIINYKPVLPFRVMIKRSIMNPSLLKPRKAKQEEKDVS